MNRDGTHSLVWKVVFSTGPHTLSCKGKELQLFESRLKEECVYWLDHSLIFITKFYSTSIIAQDDKSLLWFYLYHEGQKLLTANLTVLAHLLTHGRTWYQQQRYGFNPCWSVLLLSSNHFLRALQVSIDFLIPFSDYFSSLLNHIQLVSYRIFLCKLNSWLQELSNLLSLCKVIFILLMAHLMV